MIINLNGRDVDLNQKRISYHELSQLVGTPFVEVYYTHSNGRPGFLVSGETLYLEEGMKITVVPESV